MAIVFIELVTLFIAGLLVLRLYYNELCHLICISAIFSITLSLFINAGLHYFDDIDQTQSHFNQPVTDLPVVLWWTQFTKSSHQVRKCYSRQCIFTDDRRLLGSSAPKAIAFYGSSFNVTDLPLPRSTEIWALLHEESPRNNPHLLSESVLSLFNFSSTFSRDSHLPLTLMYLQTIADIRDSKYFVPTKKKNALRDSLAPIVYVQSNCDTLTNRDAYVANLSKFVNIDSYGSCFHNADLPENLTGAELFDSEEFLHFVSRYKFTLTIENAVCEDYITEKLWRTLTVGSVPIYFGSPSVRDWLPNFDSAILISEFSEAEQLAAYIKELDKNDVRYNDFLRHKLESGTSISNKLLKTVLRSRRWWNFDSVIEEFECQLCLRLHRPDIKDSRVDESHYKCDISKTVSGDTASTREWLSVFRSAACDGIVLREFVTQNISYYSDDELRRRSVQLMAAGDC